MARGAFRAQSKTAAVLRSLREELADRGWTAGLTLLSGGDLYHLDAAQRALLQTLVPSEASDFALTVFGEERVDLATVVAAARSVGMFASRRVVLVREVGALEGQPEALVDYAKKPPANSYLLVRAPQLDRRRKLHQALSKCGRQLLFEAIDPSAAAERANEVVDLARVKGMQLERAAAALLAELCGGDFYRIDGELEKMRAWLGGEVSRRIDSELVREIASGSGLLSGWAVADAIVQRDRPAALAAMRRLLDSGEEPLKMLGGVAFRARGMIRAKALIERGMGEAQAIRGARLFSDNPRRIAEGLARYSLAELRRFPAHLIEADRTLKSRMVPARAVMETLVDRMTQADRGRTAST